VEAVDVLGDEQQAVAEAVLEKPSGDATSSTRWPSQRPPAARKVGTPDSAETPAPVSTRTRVFVESGIVDMAS
jgi:hypothetical protein